MKIINRIVCWLMLLASVALLVVSVFYGRNILFPLIVFIFGIVICKLNWNEKE
jgi:hypothetical protein